MLWLPLDDIVNGDELLHFDDNLGRLSEHQSRSVPTSALPGAAPLGFFLYHWGLGLGYHWGLGLGTPSLQRLAPSL